MSAQLLLAFSRNDGARMPQVTEQDIADWCSGYLRRTLKLPDGPIDPHAEFTSLGLDSAESVFLVSALEDWLGLELASDTAIEHPSVAQLSSFVASRLDATPIRA
jgi:acyl carrier protein